MKRSTKYNLQRTTWKYYFVLCSLSFVLYQSMKRRTKYNLQGTTRKYYVVLCTLFFVLYLLSTPMSHAQITHDFHETPLLEALQTISREQSDYTIDILSDSLGSLQTSAQFKNLSVLDAVKRICKGLPVRVKRKGKHLFLQYRPEKDYTGRIIHFTGDVKDGFLEIPLPNAKVSILRADSSVVVDSADMVPFYNRERRIVRSLFGAAVKVTEKNYLVRAQLDGYAHNLESHTEQDLQNTHADRNHHHGAVTHHVVVIVGNELILHAGQPGVGVIVLLDDEFQHGSLIHGQLRQEGERAFGL